MFHADSAFARTCFVTASIVALVLGAPSAAVAAPRLFARAERKATPAPVLPPPPPPPASSSAASTTSTTSAIVAPGGPHEGAPPQGTTATSGADRPREGTRTGDAAEPSPFTVSPLLGYSTDNLNFGIGARAGKILFLPHLYVGGTLVYQFGKSVSTSVGGVNAEASYSAFYVGPEVGYEIPLPPVTVRLYAGLGIAAITASAHASGGAGATAASADVSDTETKLVIWPGATMLYDIPDSRFFVGADARLVSVPGGPAFGFFALGGMKL